MDPVGTLWSIAAIVVALQQFAESYEDAPALLLSIRAQVKVVETGVRRVQEWLHFTEPRSRAEVQGSLQEAIATVDSSVRSLKESLDSILPSGPKATKILGRQGSDRWTQTKYAWNEKTLNRHLADMRECALLLAFTLTVCQLPTGRPAEHAIEELGNVARTLSRAHRSTRSGRRVVLAEAKTATAQDQSPDLKVLMEGVLAAEDALSGEDDIGDPTAQHNPAIRQQSQEHQQASERCIEFLNSQHTASQARRDELFLGGPAAVSERRPNIPPKVSKSILRKPLPSRNDSSVENLSRFRTVQTPKILADSTQEANSRARSIPDLSASTLPGVVTLPTLQQAFTREPAPPMSTNISGNFTESDRSISRSLARITPAARQPQPNQASIDTECHSVRPANPTDEEDTPRALSLDDSEKELCTIDSRSSSPPPYLSPTMSQLTLLSRSDSIAPEQAPIPITMSDETHRSQPAVANTKDDSSPTCPPLIQAVRTNDEDLLRLLLEQGTDTLAQDQDTACTALMEAARLSRREMCRLLLQSGSRLSQKDVEGRTTLHVAAMRNDAIVCRMLLDAGAQVSVGDRQGYTPLRLAVQAGSHEAVACLLEATPVSKATINDPELVGSFLEGVKLGDIATAQEFILKHINLKAIKDTSKLAACAAQSGSIQMLNLVLVQKGSLKATSPDGFTVLHHAAQEGHPAMIEHLLAKGAPWKAQTKKRKETALHLAIAANQPLAALTLIHHKDAKVTIADSDNQEPLHYATRTGCLPTVTALLAAGANLNPSNSYGWKPLHIAAAYNHQSLTALFITHSTNLEAPLSAASFKGKNKTHTAAQRAYWAELRWPHEGARPLHLAIEFGHADMARLLLAAGARHDAPDFQRWTPLHYAAFGCEPDVVEVLLGRGCSPHATTLDGNTPRGLGFREGGLVAAGADDGGAAAHGFSEDAKARVAFLLQQAEGKRRQSGFARVLRFRLGGAGRRAVGERNRIWLTAGMAEGLYRDRGGGGGGGGGLGVLEDGYGGGGGDDGESSQGSVGGRPSAMSSSVTLTAAGYDRRTDSTLSLR